MPATVSATPPQSCESDFAAGLPWYGCRRVRIGRRHRCSQWSSFADGERAPAARQFDQKYGRADGARTILRLVPQREVDRLATRPARPHRGRPAHSLTRDQPAASGRCVMAGGYALAFRRFAHG
ncbi:hypothetical protein GCM10011608_42390 [Micromonospora sonchi]|uniref:Uncharacterized protein n=1 Tax=Micromonospora sonchi TaxID=1763543 RepID=A0A917U3S8_9ACTN|nr:hypothetical protein GCM10011608_42390 [Micromonospora sonchi]